MSGFKGTEEYKNLSRDQTLLEVLGGGRGYVRCIGCGGRRKVLSEYVEGWWVRTKNQGAGGEIIIGVLVSYETRTIMGGARRLV